MDTYNRIKAEQDLSRSVAHEKAMEKSPWIRESVQAFRNATPEQLAEVEAYRKRVYGWQCDEYHIANVLNVRIWICICQPPNV